VLLTGAINAYSRRQLEQQVAVLTGGSAEIVGNVLYVGAFPDDERMSVVYRVPSVSVELLKTVCMTPETVVNGIDESSVIVRGSMGALRRIEQSVNALRSPGAGTVACRVWLSRASADALVSLSPMQVNASALAGNTLVDGTFAFGSQFVSEATSVYSIPRTNVSPEGTVQVIGFTEVPIGFKASVICRDLGNVCEVRLTLSDGDALDGKEPPTRSVNTFTSVAVIPYDTNSVIGAYAKNAGRASVKLGGAVKVPFTGSLGATIQRYHVIVNVRKAIAGATVNKPAALFIDPNKNN
jgi:hypothetical protein